MNQLLINCYLDQKIIERNLKFSKIFFIYIEKHEIYNSYILFFYIVTRQYIFECSPKICITQGIQYWIYLKHIKKDFLGSDI